MKHENHNPTGAFKVRGGLNLVGALTPEERARGIVTASTGNHGQSIALASRLHGVAVHGVRAGRQQSREERGDARVRRGGRRGRRAISTRPASAASSARRETGARYVHSANEPLLIAGVGTYALEIFEELPDADVVFVPIGGGSGACGLITVRNALGSTARIIGVRRGERRCRRALVARRRTRGRRHRPTRLPKASPRASPSTYRSASCKQHLDDFVLLTEEELAEGVRLALRATHNLAEGAGSASLAAASKLTASLAGQRVVCVMSGGNLDRAQASGGSVGVAAAAATDALNTSSYIAAVTFPVFVFCREGW